MNHPGEIAPLARARAARMSPSSPPSRRRISAISAASRRSPTRRRRSCRACCRAASRSCRPTRRTLPRLERAAAGAPMLLFGSAGRRGRAADRRRARTRTAPTSSAEIAGSRVAFRLARARPAHGDERGGGARRRRRRSDLDADAGCRGAGGLRAGRRARRAPADRGDRRRGAAARRELQRLRGRRCAPRSRVLALQPARRRDRGARRHAGTRRSRPRRTRRARARRGAPARPAVHLRAVDADAVPTPCPPARRGAHAADSAALAPLVAGGGAPGRRGAGQGQPRQPHEARRRRTRAHRTTAEAR